MIYYKSIRARQRNRVLFCEYARAEVSKQKKTAKVKKINSEIVEE